MIKIFKVDKGRSDFEYFAVNDLSNWKAERLIHNKTGYNVINIYLHGSIDLDINLIEKEKYNLDEL